MIDKLLLLEKKITVETVAFEKRYKWKNSLLAKGNNPASRRDFFI